MGDVICPIMAKGWLANTHSAKEVPRKHVHGFPVGKYDPTPTWQPDNLPKCVGAACALFNGVGCGLAVDPAPKVTIINNSEGGG